MFFQNTHHVVFNDIEPCDDFLNEDIKLENLFIEKRSKSLTIIDGSVVITRDLGTPFGVGITNQRKLEFIMSKINSIKL